MDGTVRMARVVKYSQTIYSEDVLATVGRLLGVAERFEHGKTKISTRKQLLFHKAQQLTRKTRVS